MTLLVSVPEPDRLAYGFIQQTLGLTGGNLTIHLRKLEAAGYLAITKEFQGAKPEPGCRRPPPAGAPTPTICRTYRGPWAWA